MGAYGSPEHLDFLKRSRTPQPPKKPDDFNWIRFIINLILIAGLIFFGIIVASIIYIVK